MFEALEMDGGGGNEIDARINAATAEQLTQMLMLGIEGAALARKCRVCGCTDNDCRQCLAKTGRPCFWVEEDLCSACVRPAGRSQPRAAVPHKKKKAGAR